CDVHDAQRIDRHRQPDVLDRIVFPERLAAYDAGIVDQDVDLADLAAHTSSGLLDRFVFRDVDDVREDLPALAAQCARRVVPRRLIDVPQYDRLRALSNCEFGIQTAHAHGRSGDQYGFARNALHDAGPR